MREQKKEQLFKAFLREKIKNENAGLLNEKIISSVFDNYQVHEGDRPFCKNYILQRIREQEREQRRNYAEQGLLFEENPENPLPENRNLGFGPPR
ncbi:hypothetical protein KJ761_01565 [Patescibacteria group bacterium]|nr:hypothetical protein [Patescibacteria group bacterium]